MIFFVIYYIISISGEKMAKEGTWDAVWGMWISSLILTPIAAYLTWKATNDSSLLDQEWYYARYQKVKEWFGRRVLPHAKRLSPKRNKK